MIFELLAIPALAALNHIRGGWLWQYTKPLRLRPLYIVSAILVPIAWLISQSWIWAGLFGLAYLIWGVGPWGRWYDLGRLPDGFAREGIKPSIYEKIIGFSGNDHVSLFLRHLMVTIGVLPLCLWSGNWVIVFLSVILAAAIVACYEIAWRVEKIAPISVAEVLSGAAWGVFLLVISGG